MPLLKIHSLHEGGAWGIWHMEETEEALSFVSMESCPPEIVNRQKRLEWLTGRALLKALVEHFGLEYQGLRKDEWGKPFLIGHDHQISLSHSSPYVVAQIDHKNPVGIDLEQPKQKLKNIAHRVFSEAEVSDAADDIVKLCIYWCGKESLYKIYGKRNLLFSTHLRIMPFAMSDEGSVTGKIQLPESETVVPLQYLVKQDFVIVYTDRRD